MCRPQGTSDEDKPLGLDVCEASGGLMSGSERLTYLLPNKERGDGQVENLSYVICYDGHSNLVGQRHFL